MEEKTKGKNVDQKSSNVKTIRTHTVDKKDASQRKSVVRSKKDLKSNRKNTVSKVSSASSDAVKSGLSRIGRTALRQNDVTQDAVDMYDKLKNSKRASKYTFSLVKRTGGGSKYVVNKGYNVGRSTAKTLKKGARFTKQTTVALKNTKAVSTASRSMQLALHNAMQTARQSAILFAKAIASMIVNPVSWLVAGGLGFILLLLVATSSIFSSNVVQQTEFTLNQSWLQISKTDREKSNSEVEYYTNIDDILGFMNYRYGGEWEPDANWSEGTGGAISGFFGFNHYSDALNDLWLSLNDDKDNLKEMKDLYKPGGSGKDWVILDEDDYNDYNEILEAQKETGKYSGYIELDNPLSASEPSGVVYITSRYGYKDKDTIDPTTTIQTQANSKLYAPLDGKVTVSKKDLLNEDTETENIIITTKDSKFIFYDVENIQVKTGDTVEAGKELATVKKDSVEQKIAYAKDYGKVDDSDPAWLKDIRDNKSNYGYKDKDNHVWVMVNPGFYFQFVEYRQKTTVVKAVDLDADISKRIDQVYNLMKKYYPKTTKTGASAFIGNFWVESSINPKTAEGDFLNPPVGATESSWDDPNWLAIGGPSIYNGGYTNIIHRGLGLGQFTDTSDGGMRHTLLLEYAKSKGMKWYDLELQIDFIFNGDDGYHQAYAKKIAEADDSQDVATVANEFATFWEGNSGDKALQRQAYAKQVLDYLKNPTGGKYKGSIDRNGKYAPPFDTDFWVMQPFGRTAWSQGAGASLYSITGQNTGHTGVDLSPMEVQYGTTVLPHDYAIYSVTDGTVISTGSSGIGGNYIMIKIKDTEQVAYYGHLKEVPNFTAGQQIKAGQQIALLGNTGATTIYHVHFEVSNSSVIGGTDSMDPSGYIIQSGTLTQNQTVSVKK